MALEETVCQVCVEGHEPQFHWVCRCSHRFLVSIRDVAYRRMEELLSVATSGQPAIGRLVLGMAKADDGHRVCIGDWSAANVRSARSGIPEASLHDVKWTLKLIQPILIQIHDLWDTRTAILSGVPIPGTKPRLRRQRFYAVAEGENRGVYESYAEVQL